MIREIDFEIDYEKIVSWWEGHKWPIISKSQLPKIGFICNEIAACFLYQTDSSIAWMEWIVTDPHSDPIARDKALDEVILHTVFRAYQLGFKELFTTSSHGRLSERLTKHQFMIGDQATTTYIRRLEQCQ